MANLNTSILRSLQLLVPDIQIQERFNVIIRPILSQTAILYDCKERLIEMRDRLLTRLISGKLPVEDLDIQFPPSMVDDYQDSSR